jgi:hypothetical protein
MLFALYCVKPEAFQKPRAFPSAIDDHLIEKCLMEVATYAYLRTVHVADRRGRIYECREIVQLSYLRDLAFRSIFNLPEKENLRLFTRLFQGVEHSPQTQDACIFAAGLTYATLAIRDNHKQRDR